ncbi:MAG TPA: NAD(P)-dependent oxidoreductase [Gemmatimonadales bacterium]|jgi:nucleoside-diphosphate-sugar epimerase|nr:NAD(P)-dependent oxidoreductase [Gemmatimonadales bacterium]
MQFSNVLVTGSGGLLGRHVVRELAERCKVSGFDRQRAPENVPQTVGDVTDLAAVRAACAGRDAVVHIAAMPNIWSGPGERIMTVNVTGTWNVLQAAEDAGVKRVILCSSDSVVGFTVMSGGMRPPDYVPVDQAHPLRPTDPYALSKLLGEQIGRSFVERGKLEVAALRPVFVLYPEMHGEVKARAQDPANYKGPAVGGPSAAGGGPLWHYVDPRDVARAFRLALEVRSFAAFEGFFISATSTLAPNPTLQRLEQYLKRPLEVRRLEIYAKNPHAPLYDLARAREVLGFEAQHDLRHLIN